MYLNVSILCIKCSSVSRNALLIENLHMHEHCASEKCLLKLFFLIHMIDLLALIPFCSSFLFHRHKHTACRTSLNKGGSTQRERSLTKCERTLECEGVTGESAASPSSFLLAICSQLAFFYPYFKIEINNNNEKDLQEQIERDTQYIQDRHDLKTIPYQKLGNYSLLLLYRRTPIY